MLTVGSHIIIGKVILSVVYTPTFHSVHSGQSHRGKVILSVFYTLTFPSAHSGQSPIGKVTLSVIFYSHLPQCSQLAVRYREGNSIGVLHSHLSRQELKTVSDLSCLSNGLLRLFRIKKKLEQS